MQVVADIGSRKKEFCIVIAPKQLFVVETCNLAPCIAYCEFYLAKRLAPILKNRKLHGTKERPKLFLLFQTRLLHLNMPLEAGGIKNARSSYCRYLTCVNLLWWDVTTLDLEARSIHDVWINSAVNTCWTYSDFFFWITALHFEASCIKGIVCCLDAFIRADAEGAFISG